MITDIKEGIRQKGRYWHTTLIYWEDGIRQERWRSTGLPVENNKRKAKMLSEERGVAFRKEAEERNRIESWGADTAVPDMLFADLMQQWMQRKAPSISQSTKEGYQRILSYADPYFRKRELAVRQITPVHVQQYLASLQSRRSKPLSGNTIKKHIVLLKSVFNESIKDGALVFNPVRRVVLPKAIPYQATTYTADELNDLFIALDANELRDIVMVTAFYGLRRSEVCGLRWQDIDFEQNMLYVRHKVLETRNDGKKQLTQTNELKTASSRRAFALTPTIKECLMKRYTWVVQNRALWGSCYDHTYDAYVFTLEDGSLLTPNRVSDRFRGFIERKGMKKIRFHDLRHSCATLLLREGFTLQEIQAYLGHATFQTTLRYAHLDASNKTVASNRIECLLGNKSEEAP